MDLRTLTHIIGKDLVRIIDALPPNPTVGDTKEVWYAKPDNNPKHRNCDACMVFGAPRSNRPEKTRNPFVPKVTIRHRLKNDACSAFNGPRERTFARSPQVVYDVSARLPSGWRPVRFRALTAIRGKVVLKYIGRE